MTDSPTTPTAPTAPTLRIFGFCWFHRATYARDRGLMTDPEVLFETFDQWLKSARQIEREISARGDKVVRIGFDPTEFLLFCATRGLKPDEQSRAAWAAQEVRKKYTETR
ncbi:hypothetical protein EYW49_04585 [Siculibacillus lacustris]|uniref:Uncharacterized protein n=1 Tax=Siculibacillus lacustris TaxID=1549641 RepID=A0A4Q9VUQ6_9HYPH|nr:hypothetical protein [Siculibacillus lacustris]TBW39951.1 hypothetical protein EYW49_04585 [Siculibacillus lacustris]